MVKIKEWNFQFSANLLSQLRMIYASDGEAHISPAIKQSANTLQSHIYVLEEEEEEEWLIAKRIQAGVKFKV